MGGILALGLLLMGARLAYLQIWQAEALKERAQAQQQGSVRLFLPRRSIVDRHSVITQEAELLAVDRPVFTLWVYPKLLKKDWTEVAEKLAPLLKESPEALQKKVSPGQKTGVRLARWITEETANEIRRLRFDGLGLDPERQRVYPQKEMAAEVTGYVDFDHVGQAGVEIAHQKLLERAVRPVLIPKDGYGQPMAAGTPDELIQSGDSVLQLTLDMRLQRAARTALKTQMDRFQAKRGTVIIMNPDSGEILALVSEPTYDPNRFNTGYDPSLFKNWAVTDLYEPGSTFKPINIALGLEAKAFDKEFHVYDQGRLMFGAWPIQNHDFEQKGGNGWLSVTEVLKKSSNVGMVHLMGRMTPRAFHQGLVRLGLNSATGVDLPFEPSSRLRKLEDFAAIPVERATASYGQGFSLTPLGLATLHCIIANGGWKVTPRIVRGLVAKDTGELLWQPARPESERVLSNASTYSVQTMMRDVVESGTGQLAKIEGYEIGGKTGTAQKARPNGGGYYKHKRITSFVGYFPAINPDYVILAVVDEPQGDDAYGSSVAAPIVRTIIQEIIGLEKRLPKPSYSQSN
jgi:cell division protein FtsI (penicillin-binding protein 3)